MLHRALPAACESPRQLSSPSSDTGEVSQTTSTFRFAVRSLRHRNYRLFFSGQSISMIGSWMTQVATSWLIYRLTDSAWLLGLLGFSGQIPAFFMAPFA